MATATKTRSVTEIANRLVELCRKGESHQAMRELYSQNIKSIEATTDANGNKTLEGKEAVMEESRAWREANEVHSYEMSEPMISETEFAVRIRKDITRKEYDRRETLEEIAVYSVNNGEIVQQRFFYNAQ